MRGPPALWRYCLSQNEDLPRAELLIEEGLRELPDEARYALDRASCLSNGAEVSRLAGRAQEGVARVHAAQLIVQESPLATDILKLQTSLDVASTYADAGQDSDALSEFQHAASLLSSVGWQETHVSVTLFNNWALELDQIGRPLEAEKIERHVLEIARDDNTTEAVTPMVLNNYAKFLRQLARLDEAADYGQRAYAEAEKVQNQLVIGQSLLERARIAAAQHYTSQASALLTELEPLMRKKLPPGHYAFASLSAERATVALAEGDLALALKFSNEAVQIGEAGLKKRGAGAFAFPGFLLKRSAIELASGNTEQAIVDANRALSLQKTNAQPGSFSPRTGAAYLALARALHAQGKDDEARVAARSAVEQFSNAVGPDHPDTHSALQIAGPASN